MHPLLHLLTSQPALLGEHAQGYAALLASEVTALKQATQRQLVWSVATAVSAIVGLVLAGVALMLWAALPTLPNSAQWALLLTPAVPLLVALVCQQLARAPTPAAFSQIKEQIQADMHMLAEFNPP